MKKKIFSKEMRVGIMAIVAVFILYFGLNFLKGIDIFTAVNEYYATYENIGGLVPSSPVYVKGLKVGQVEEIKYDFSKSLSFVVRISVSEDIVIPKGAKIELTDEGLMGGKAIELIYDPVKPNQALYSPGDTVESQIGGGLMAKISGDLMPKIESISTQADSLLRSVRVLIESDQIKNSLGSIEKTTADLAVSSAQLKKMMNKDLPKVIGDVSVITSDFRQVSGNLKTIDFAATFASINHSIANLNLITDKVNSKEGSIGLLLNDKELYKNLTNTADNADKLLIDLKQNPKKYVHFSLFGKKQ